MKQWLRNIKLIIGEKSEGEKAYDFSEHHIRFHITQKMNTIDTTSSIYIMNPNPKLAAEYEKSAYGQKIILLIGYGEELQTLFKGTVRQVIYARESPTDTYLCFKAGGIDKAKNYSFINKSIAAGSTQKEQRDVLLEEFKQNGAEAGYLDEPEQFEMPRGKVYFGMTNDYMRQFGATNNLNIAYNNDQVFMTAKIPEWDKKKALIINANTGMVGLPQQSANGIYVTCLLNPNIITGHTIIKLNNESIVMPEYDLTYGKEEENSWKTKAMQSGDGLYCVVSSEHSGDTRGNEWYTSVIAKGRNSVLTPNTGPAITGVSS